MFLVKARTTIKIDNQAIATGQPWVNYVTKEDKIYDKHEVWDSVSVYNADRQEMLTDVNPIPMWVRQLISAGFTVVRRDNRYALVRNQDIQFLD